MRDGLAEPASELRNDGHREDGVEVVESPRNRSRELGSHEAGLSRSRCAAMKTRNVARGLGERSESMEQVRHLCPDLVREVRRKGLHVMRAEMAAVPVNGDIAYDSGA